MPNVYEEYMPRASKVSGDNRTIIKIFSTPLRWQREHACNHNSFCSPFPRHPSSVLTSVTNMMSSPSPELSNVSVQRRDPSCMLPSLKKTASALVRAGSGSGSGISSSESAEPKSTGCTSGASAGSTSTSTGSDVSPSESSSSDAS